MSTPPPRPPSLSPVPFPSAVQPDADPGTFRHYRPRSAHHGWYPGQQFIPQARLPCILVTVQRWKASPLLAYPPPPPPLVLLPPPDRHPHPKPSSHRYRLLLLLRGGTSMRCSKKELGWGGADGGDDPPVGGGGGAGVYSFCAGLSFLVVLATYPIRDGTPLLYLIEKPQFLGAHYVCFFFFPDFWGEEESCVGERFEAFPASNRSRLDCLGPTSLVVMCCAGPV